MELIEKHDNACPDMFDGMKAYIGGEIRIRSGYMDSRRVIIRSGDTVHTNHEVRFNNGMESGFPSFNLEWGKAMSRHFFLSLSMEGYAFLIYLGYPVIERLSNPGILVRGEVYYLVNDRFFIDMGFGDFRMDRKLLIRQPDQIWLRGHVFIEEKLGLVLSLVHGYSYNGHFRNSLYNDYQITAETVTDRITVELQYEF